MSEQDWNDFLDERARRLCAMIRKNGGTIQAKHPTTLAYIKTNLYKETASVCPPEKTSS